MEKIKLFYFGDSPSVHTGFGVAAKHILNHILKSSDDFAISCLGINFYGDPHDQNHLNVYPVTTNDPYGIGRFNELLYKLNPDVIFTINDYDALFMLKDIVSQFRQKTNKNVPWIGYIPVDGEPVYPEYTSFLRTLDYVAVTSKYGRESIKKTDSGLDLDVVYHGVDRTIFHPMPEDKKKALKDGIGPDSFIVGSVGTNQLRKQWALMMEVFAEFSKDKPNAKFYMHTQPKFQGGYDVLRLGRYYGIDSKMYFPDQLRGAMGIDFSHMNQMYNLLDVYLTLHCGEGFGIPQLESMAAGTPVITHRATASEEIMGDAGILIDTEWTHIYPFGDRGLIRPIANKQQALSALNTLYSNEALRKELSVKGIERSKLFSWTDATIKFEDGIRKAYTNSLQPVVAKEIELAKLL